MFRKSPYVVFDESSGLSGPGFHSHYYQCHPSNPHSHARGRLGSSANQGVIGGLGRPWPRGRGEAEDDEDGGRGR